jgi:hypothetical protein
MKTKTAFALVIAFLTACDGGQWMGEGNPPDSNPSVSSKQTSLSLEIISPKGPKATTQSQLTVEGRLQDPQNELDQLLVNGSVVSVAADGSFSQIVTSKPGLNIVEVVAKAKNGAARTAVSSYHHAAEFWSAGSDTLDDGVMIRMQGRALDDGDRQDMDDLGSLGEMFMPLDDVVPEVLIKGSMFMMSYSARKIGKVENSPLAISITPIAGGLRMSGKGSYFQVPVAAQAGPMTVTGVGRANDMSFVADIQVEKGCQDQQLDVKVTRMVVDYGSVQMKLGSGLPGNMMSFMANNMVVFFKGPIRQNMEQHFTGLVPPLLQGFLYSIALPQNASVPLAQSKEGLPISSALCSVRFGKDGATIGLSTTVSAKPQRDGKGFPLLAVKEQSWPAQDGVGVSLQHNLLNRLLYAAWVSSSPRRDFDEKSLALESTPLASSGLQVTVDARLPPIVMPDASASKLALGLGEVEMLLRFRTADGRNATLEAKLAGVYPLGLSLSSANAITLAPEQGHVAVQLKTFAQSGLRPDEYGSAVALVNAIGRSLARPLALETVASFQLPAIDTGALTGAPPPAPRVILGQGKAALAEGNWLQMTGELTVGM